MKRLFPLLALPVLATEVQARVFETPDQCLARYGKPVTVTKTAIGSTVSYLKSGVSVTVEFRGETAVAVTYRKLPASGDEGGTRFSSVEIDKLLASNVGDHRWATVKRDMNDRSYWFTEDKALYARLVDDAQLHVEDGAEFARKAKDIPPPKPVAERDLEGF